MPVRALALTFDFFQPTYFSVNLFFSHVATIATRADPVPRPEHDRRRRRLARRPSRDGDCFGAHGREVAAVLSLAKLDVCGPDPAQSVTGAPGAVPRSGRIDPSCRSRRRCRGADRKSGDDAYRKKAFPRHFCPRSLSGTSLITRRFAASSGSRGKSHPAKKSTTPVSKLYIAPAILIAPCVSNSASTGLSLRILAIVISTFFRATASTKA